VNIVEAIRDENLFRNFFGQTLDTWKPWLCALRVIYGLPIKTSYSRKLIRECTGRDPDKLPKDGFKTALLLTGRRSGKSRIAATIGAYASILEGLEKRLAAGEYGVVPVVSPSKRQSHVVKDYLRAIFAASPMLTAEIATDRKWEGFTLKNGTKIEMLAGDYRHVRGLSLLCCVVEEICFFGLDEDSRVRSDTELIRALTPSLATTNGRLIAISSPYARKGWVWKQYQKHFGNDQSDVLIWNAPSRTMNPTLSERIVKKALAEDYQAAKSEYLGEFRDDVGIFINAELIENLVVHGRQENLPRSGTRYVAFADLSGGRNDASALAIAHRDGRKVILDALDWHPSPHNPHVVIARMIERLREWRVSRVMADAYSAEFAVEAFRGGGITCEKSKKNKSQLYSEILPVLCAGEIELLDHPRLITQLVSLERRTRSGGKDVIDHPPGSHDDLANSVAGVAVQCCAKRLTVGLF
jgi:hypothetical protein